MLGPARLVAQELQALPTHCNQTTSFTICVICYGMSWLYFRLSTLQALYLYSLMISILFIQYSIKCSSENTVTLYLSLSLSLGLPSYL